MLVPNEVLMYWFQVLLLGFLNEDWELISRFLIDMDKVVQRIKELNTKGKQANLKKQLANARKQRNPNKFERGKGKYTRVIKN